MPKKKQPEEEPREQFKRFLEAAEKAEVEETEADRKFKELADKKRKKPR